LGKRITDPDTRTKPSTALTLDQAVLRLKCPFTAPPSLLSYNGWLNGSISIIWSVPFSLELRLQNKVTQVRVLMIVHRKYLHAYFSDAKFVHSGVDLAHKITK